MLLHSRQSFYLVIVRCCLKDCSRSGRYHNKRFKEIAESHGLTVFRTDTDGWAHTELQEETRKIISSFEWNSPLLYRKIEVQDLVGLFGMLDDEEISEIIDNGQDSHEDASRKVDSRGRIVKPSSTRKYACPICGMSVRATREVNIKCGDCNVQMLFEVPRKKPSHTKICIDINKGEDENEEAIQTSA